MGHTECQPLFMPNKCVPWLQSRLHPILPCAESTPGLLRHAHIVTYRSGCRHSVSIQIFAQNIMDIIKLCAHISVAGPRLSAGLYGCPICGQGLTPGDLGEHYTQVTSSLSLSSRSSSLSSSGAGLPGQGVSLGAEESRHQAQGQDGWTGRPGAQEQMGGQYRQ